MSRARPLARGQATFEMVLVCALVVAAALLVQSAVGRAFPHRSPPQVAQVALPRARGAGGLADAAPGSVVAIALSLERLGIRERGIDRGGWVDAFTSGHPEPWCADFVSWVYMTAGRPFAGGVDGWRIASAPGLQAWFERRAWFSARGTAAPAPGDVVSFRHEHVGIVVSASPSEIETVEGNSGDAVAVRRYPGWRANADIAGFGRWPAGGPSEGNFPGPASV
jgi:hypothetical protein